MHDVLGHKLRPELRRDQSGNEVQNLSTSDVWSSSSGMGEEIFQTNRFQRWKYEKVQVFGLMKSESVNWFILKVPIHVPNLSR